MAADCSSAWRSSGLPPLQSLPPPRPAAGVGWVGRRPVRHRGGETRMAVLGAGGGGFIGSSMVNLLADPGRRVRLLDARRTIDPRRREVEVVAADLRDRRA